MAGPIDPTRRRRRAGFTLTELMIAVVVLIAILLGTSKIFNTTSQVTGAGQATADIMQEVAAIERQLREDFARLAPNGVFAIRCVSVPNDIRGLSGPLLNPNLPPGARVRADQLVYFVNGVESAQTFRVGAGASQKGQGTAARVYFGHGFQLGDAAEPTEFVGGAQGFQRPRAHDPNEVVFPWSFGTVDMVRTFYRSRGGSDDVYDASGGNTINIAPVDARRWPLARQPVLLVDDDAAAPWLNEKTVYLGEVASARSIFLQDPRDRLGWTPQIFHGRVDASAVQLADLGPLLEYTASTPIRRRWWLRPGLSPTDQFSMIVGAVPPADGGPMGLLYYPRAERRAPSMSRVDQALTNPILGVACSSVRVDWTYADGVGETFDEMGEFRPGVTLDPEFAQPWFGLWEDPRNQNRGYVRPYGDVRFDRWTVADAVFPRNVERVELDSPRFGQADVYEAVFGFNQTAPLVTNPLSSDFGTLHEDNGYTPWPTAIRITLTLHDPKMRLESGREVQFVIDLPERAAIATP